MLLTLKKISKKIQKNNDKYKKSIKNIWQTYNNSVKYDCYEKKERDLVSTRLQKVMGIKAKDY